MQPYILTNVQLFNQLKREGYTNTDLSSIIKTYEFAVQMFTGRFQPSGNPFITHGIRTASILCSLHMQAEVVAAGLIHSVYRKGGFGDGTVGISEGKRKQVRRAVGKNVQEYVDRFEARPWNKKTICDIRDNLNTFNEIEQNVVLIRLANVLEHHLDLEILYYYDPKKCKEDIKHYGEVIVAIARNLGYPTLAADLHEAFRNTVAGEISVEIRNVAERIDSFGVIRTLGRQESVIIVPKSYNKRV